jgi:RNA-directed DNA polymerase
VFASVDSRTHKVRATGSNPYRLGEGRQFCVLDTINGEVLLMQTATIQRRIEQLPALSRAGKRINGLHRLMRSPYLYERAYVRVSGNKGAATPGVDGQTFDGTSLEKLASLARRVAQGRYRPRPVRRVYIPKASGKLRPLGIPTVEDRLVQEVVRIILAAIYEPVFSQHSHGFRPGRSCHTALEEIRNTWTGVKWLIEVDVRGFFDNIDHDILLKLLARRIDDERFIGLIAQMLKAGCLDDWVFERTYSGTPQGGVVSPILANIYLHELDLFMAEMQAGFDRGRRRRAHPGYTALERRIRHLRREVDALRADGADDAEVRVCLEQIKAANRERRVLPSVDPMDPNFRRLRYCRYADDFLIGIIGGKAEAEQVMTDVQEFLSARLNLAVSAEKSGIVAASKGVPFLGYRVCAFTLRSPGTMARRQCGGGRPLRVRCRPTRGNIKLWVPLERVYAFCRRKGYGNLDTRDGRSRPQFLDSSDAEIIVAFNSELRGFANYYAIADGVKSSLDRLELVVFRSVLATVAARHRKSSCWAKKHLKLGLDYGVAVMVQGKPCVLKLWKLKHLNLKPWRRAAVDNITVGVRLAQSRNDLIARLSARTCEACGDTDGPFEMHHGHALKDKRGAPFTAWKQSARRRKTMALCRRCHVALHAGRRASRTESRVR